MIDSISAVIITKNAATTLADTLKSLKSFDEVVILDNGSEDDTETIARQFSNVNFHIDTFEGFGPTKNKAVSLAKNDWIFSLDADETLTPELESTLANWGKNKPTDHYGIILRENYFMGKAIHRAGWGNDKLVRLFHRQHYRFNNARVHESVEISTEGKEIQLNGVLKHNAIYHLGQLLEKVNRYSELRQQDIIDKDKTPSSLIIFLKTLFAFFRSYILQLGCLEGWRGLVIAYSNANGVFFKYMKAYSKIHS